MRLFNVTSSSKHLCFIKENNIIKHGVLLSLASKTNVNAGQIKMLRQTQARAARSAFVHMGCQTQHEMTSPCSCFNIHLFFRVMIFVLIMLRADKLQQLVLGWNSKSILTQTKILTCNCMKMRNLVFARRQSAAYERHLRFPTPRLQVWFLQLWCTTQYSLSCCYVAMPSGMHHRKDGERRGGIKLRKVGFYVSCLLMLWHTLISFLCMLAFCSC